MMNRLFLKRSLRILKSNAGRYGSLFLLCAMAMFLVVGIVAASISIMDVESTKALETALEDGSFETFVPLTRSQMEELESMAEVESKESMDFHLKDQTKIRIFKNRNHLDQIIVEQGNMPESTDEIVLEKNYAAHYNLQPGDSISFGGRTWTVSGIGVAMDYGNVLENMSDLNSNPGIFTIGFVSDTAFDALKQSGQALRASTVEYAFRMKNGTSPEALRNKLEQMKIPLADIEDPYFLELVDPEGQMEDLDKLTEHKDEILTAIQSLQDANTQIDQSFDHLNQAMQTEASPLMNRQKYQQISSALAALETGFDVTSKQYEKLSNEVLPFLDQLSDLDSSMEVGNLRQFVEADENPRIKAASTDVELNLNTGLLAGVVLIILLSYVFSILIGHIIDGESSILGTWMALGFTSKELMQQYIWIPVIVTFLGGLAGTVLACLPGVFHYFLQSSMEYYSVPEPPLKVPGFLLVYGLVLPPAMSALIVYISLKNRLKKDVLDLIHGKGRQNHPVKIKVSGSFLANFQRRQLKKESVSLGVMLLGIFFSLLLLALCLNCYYLCTRLNENVSKDVRYEYQYVYKYPEYPARDPDNQAYMEEVKAEVAGSEVPFSLIGITDTTDYFPRLSDLSVSELSVDECVLSLSASQKLQKSTGDTIQFTDSTNQTRSFRVRQIVDYQTGLFIFTSLDNMRQLFNQPDDYYNTIFSSQALDIDPDRLYSVTDKADLITSSTIFMEMMASMVCVLSAAAVVVFVTILYQLCRVLLEKNSEKIALMKILGYNTREIRKLYFNADFYVLAAALPFLIAAAKWTMDKVYPVLISNVNSGMPLAWDWQVYAGIYGFILLFFLGIEALMTRKIEKMDYTRLLKKRD